MLSFKQFFKYLKYLMTHRKWVRDGCFDQGLYLQGIFHDWHKYLPGEFIPYAKFFYNKDGSKKQLINKTGYSKPTNTGDPNFDFAWFLHQARAKHHWQYWVVPEADGSLKAFPMKNRYWREMLCDWRGAGIAQGVEQDLTDYWKKVREWYIVNKDKMILHDITRKEIEDFIGYER